MKKHPYKTDIAVLMLFFNRADSFSKVFAEVKKARPSSCSSIRTVLVAIGTWQA